MGAMKKSGGRETGEKKEKRNIEGKKEMERGEEAVKTEEDEEKGQTERR